MREQLSTQELRGKNEPGVAKELADVGIGAGLVVAGPELAKSVLNETAQATGANLSLPAGSEALEHIFDVGVETAQGFTGIAVVGTVIYIGGKKLLEPFISTDN